MPSLFLSCSADWTVRLWSEDQVSTSASAVLVGAFLDMHSLPEPCFATTPLWHQLGVLHKILPYCDIVFYANDEPTVSGTPLLARNLTSNLYLRKELYLCSRRQTWQLLMFGGHSIMLAFLLWLPLMVI